MNLTNFRQVLRSLVRRKHYAVINILGLGIGLGCVILMATFLIHEFSFDNYHNNAGNLYRVVDGKNCATYYAMGDAFKKEIPEIKSVCRLSVFNEISIKKDVQYITEKNIIFSDTNLLDILNIDLLLGNKANQLRMPNEIMISEKMADKYFPNNDPVGNTMEIGVAQNIFSFKVSGVFKNFPSNSSLQTDFIGSIENAFSLLWDIEVTIGFKKEDAPKDYRNIWERNEFTTFLQIHPGANLASVEKKCSDICLKYREDNKDGGIRLQKYNRMYLHSNDFDNTRPFETNQLGSLKIFMGIGVLILLVAILNFILISNADNKLSIKEIACRKVNGASKKQILAYSLSKSLLVAFISLIPALLFVQFLMPVFNQLFQKNLSISLFLQWPYLVSLLAITIITGICAGLYLGFYIAGINPASLLQKRIAPGRKQGKFNGSLIIAQFVVFILLASSFLLMVKQYNYSLKKDLGLNHSNLVAIDINEDGIKNKVEYLQNELLANPNVLDCKPTSLTIPPSDNRLNISFKDKETDESVENEALIFGRGVIEMLGIKMVDGRAFNESDKGFNGFFIINEAAAKKFNVKAGEKIGGVFNVLGITKNFHFHSLHRPVEPVFIALQTENYPYLLIKTNGENHEVIEFSRQLCQQISPGYYMKAEILDSRIEKFYEKEEKQMGTIGFFAAIAMGLSIMGLLGFVSLSLINRTKEIGIRKINGAKIIELIKMVNFQYFKWIIIAFVIACPVAYYTTSEWLENFAYHTSISWWIFLVVGIFAMVITMITISWQSWKAARKNPVEALRYE